MHLLRNLSCINEKVLVRVDFNVPFENNQIVDPFKIEKSLPTLNYLLSQNNAIILISHRGKGSDSLKACQEILTNYFSKQVLFAPDCMKAHSYIQTLKQKEIILLENLRQYPAEESPSIDPNFAKTLAGYGTFYVNDAFAACHRAHSSIIELPRLFKNRAAAGFLLEKEVETLQPLSSHPKKPFHVILGGAKASSKLGLIHSILDKIDALYIGGAMAFTFMKAKNQSIGNSPFEPSLLKDVEKILLTCQKKNIKIHLPKDFKTDLDLTETPSIPEGANGMDVGSKTISSWSALLQEAKTIFWNGPIGAFENPRFAKGTFDLMNNLSLLSSIRIIGGGDTVSALRKIKKEDCFTYVSTGGGATLKLIEKGSLPGIDALSFPNQPLIDS